MNGLGSAHTGTVFDLTSKCDTTLSVTIIDETTTPTFAGGAAAGLTATDLSLCESATGYPNGSITINTGVITDGSGNYAYEVYQGNSVVADSLLLIDGSQNIYAQKGIVAPAGTLAAVTQNGDVIEGLNEGAYTIVVIDTDTGCKIDPATATITTDPTRSAF